MTGGPAQGGNPLQPLHQGQWWQLLLESIGRVDGGDEYIDIGVEIGGDEVVKGEEGVVEESRWEC